MSMLARPINGVPELAKIFPRRCIVRENIKAYLSPKENPGEKGGGGGGGGPTLTFEKTKILPAGEQLKLLGELSLPSPSEKGQYFISYKQSLFFFFLQIRFF